MKKLLMSVMCITFAVVACGSADEPKQSDPPQVVAPETQPQSFCIQRISCYDGSEYCCKTNTCVVAKCEPPQWNRVSCSCL